MKLVCLTVCPPQSGLPESEAVVGSGGRQTAAQRAGRPSGERDRPAQVCVGVAMTCDSFTELHSIQTTLWK